MKLRGVSCREYARVQQDGKEGWEWVLLENRGRESTKGKRSIVEISDN